MALSTLGWRKSPYSEEASSCVYVAAADDGAVLLRESDEPDVVLVNDTTHAAGVHIEGQGGRARRRVVTSRASEVPERRAEAHRTRGGSRGKPRDPPRVLQRLTAP
ncbi:DUF397 domain-containing protein [Streptomyces sp. NPDC059679]|uniref:DUF397 domain-containing protein n=1 Tax=Streptomyces sp. NPDC059679 TaxID=3346903 RepID=UPI00368C88F5